MDKKICVVIGADSNRFYYLVTYNEKQKLLKKKTDNKKND